MSLKPLSNPQSELISLLSLLWHFLCVPWVAGYLPRCGKLSKYSHLNILSIFHLLFFFCTGKIKDILLKCQMLFSEKDTERGNFVLLLTGFNIMSGFYVTGCGRQRLAPLRLQSSHGRSVAHGLFSGSWALPLVTGWSHCTTKHKLCSGIPTLFQENVSI